MTEIYFYLLALLYGIIKRRSGVRFWKKKPLVAAYDTSHGRGGISIPLSYLSVPMSIAIESRVSSKLESGFIPRGRRGRILCPPRRRVLGMQV